MIDNQELTAFKPDYTSADIIRDLEVQLTQTQQKLDVAVEALKFYADDGNWFSTDTHFHTFTYIADEDDGEIAKAALNTIGDKANG